MVTDSVIQLPSNQVWMEEIFKNPTKYEALFVVHTDIKIEFTSKSPLKANKWLNENDEKFGNNLRIFLVPTSIGQIRLRMLKIKSLLAGDWMPMSKVIFLLPKKEKFPIEMLVDSGADVTFIPFNIGKMLGFQKSFGEPSLYAAGVGSKVKYLIRECKILIDDTELTIRLLWGQDESVSDILLGRLDVFDYFDVTISKNRQKVIFQPINIAS
jgi:predicted aspartyl protease